MWTACLGRGDDLIPQAIAIAPRRIALGTPLIDETRVERAQNRMEPGGARKRADVIENVDLDRILRLGCGYRLLPLLGGGSFRRGDEPRAEIDPDRAQHQRRRDAAPVEDAPGGDDRDWRHGVDDLRHECHRADLAAIAAGLAALRDDDVDASLGRLHRLRHRRDLQHHERPDVVGLPHQIPRVAEREGDHSRACLKRVAKCLGVQCLRNVVDRKRPACQLPHRVDVALDGGAGSEQRSHAPQAAFVRHRSRELRRRAGAHGRQDDRHLDAKQVAERRLQHLPSPSSNER